MPKALRFCFSQRGSDEFEAALGSILEILFITGFTTGINPETRFTSNRFHDLHFFIFC